VVLFASVHHALRAERLLEAEGIPYKLIPVPRHLSSTCGFCVRFEWSDRERVEPCLAQAKVPFERIVAL
jgi:hypothetical protein